MYKENRQVHISWPYSYEILCTSYNNLNLLKHAKIIRCVHHFYNVTSENKPISKHLVKKPYIFDFSQQKAKTEVVAWCRNPLCPELYC